MKIFNLLIPLILISCNSDAVCDHSCNIFEQDIQEISEFDMKTICLFEENDNHVCDIEGKFETCCDFKIDTCCYNDNGKVICK